MALSNRETETFAYADGWDEEKKRYKGLRAGQSIRVLVDTGSLLVKPDIAAAQIEADRPQPGRRQGSPGNRPAFECPGRCGNRNRSGSPPKIPDGASPELVRTITENCRTLKFENYGFEET